MTQSPALPAAARLPDGAPACARRLMVAIEQAAPRLLAVAALDSGRKPAPGKWSPREIVGHLVDSASNNHQRFVRARGHVDLVVDGYEQDGWVAAQRYQDAPWEELVLLWQLYNRHLARVMAATSDADLTRRRSLHNLHQRAFRAVPVTEPATLEYFMNDYVDHLEHHLGQILH